MEPSMQERAMESAEREEKLTENHFPAIIKQLGTSELLKLFDQLKGLTSEDIKRLRLSQDKHLMQGVNIQLQAKNVFKAWMAGDAVKATRKAVITALGKCDNHLAEENLKDHWKTEVGKFQEGDISTVLNVGELTPSNIHSMFLSLGLKEYYIAIHSGVERSDFEQQASNVFHGWIKTKPRPTIGDLLEALENADNLNASQELQTLWETPAEILARGQAALDAYIKASQDGTKSVYRTRLMLVGQERVGKTSLKKNITGQKFKSTESITDGIDASTRCEVAENSNEPWEIQRTDLANHVQSQYDDTIRELIRENKELQSDNQLAAGDSQQRIWVPKKSLDETQNQTTEPSREEEKKHVTQPVVADSLREEVLKEMEKWKLRNDKLEDHDKENSALEFQIWDFAGQDVYYTTHQVFLSNRAIYIVIFDLCHDLTKPVKIQIQSGKMKVQSRFHELTGLEFLDFWMQSIYAYATTNKQPQDEKRDQFSPPIFIVGTHRDSPDISKDPDEREKLLEAKKERIERMIAGKPYEKHVVSRYYAIENSSTDTDAELSDLREHIASVAKQEPYMTDKIPLRWLKFEKSVAEAINDDRHYLYLEEVKYKANDLGIKSDTGLFTMLHFYHDLGTIIFFGGEECTNSNLKNMVILDPQWLIDVFKRIITMLPNQKQRAILKKEWRRLKEEGILENCLINHVWKDLLPQKPTLLALMEMFDLLCPRILADKEGVKSYYVPACLQPCSEQGAGLQMAEERKLPTIYVDFHGFLPDGLFNQLIVRAARWSQEPGGEEPKLFHRYGEFYFDKEHNFELKMITTKPVRIKVTISTIQTVMTPGESEEDSYVIQPIHRVFNSVKTFLTDALRQLNSTWFHGIEYTFKVACPCNDSSQPPQPNVSRCFHLLPLKECLVETKIRCKKKLYSTQVFKSWFQGVAGGKSVDASTPVDPKSDFRDITRLLGPAELQKLYPELNGLSRPDIQKAECSAGTYDDVDLKARAVLHLWHKRNGSVATRQAVIQALERCRNINAAEKLSNMWNLRAPQSSTNTSQQKRPFQTVSDSSTVSVAAPVKIQKSTAPQSSTNTSQQKRPFQTVSDSSTVSVAAPVKIQKSTADKCCKARKCLSEIKSLSVDDIHQSEEGGFLFVSQYIELVPGGVKQCYNYTIPITDQQTGLPREVCQMAFRKLFHITAANLKKAQGAVKARVVNKKRTSDTSGI